MTKRMIVGVDIGGTTIKIALLDPNGEIITKTQIPTPVSEGEDAIIGKMTNTIDQLMAEQGFTKEEAYGIGIGVPGPVDTDTGFVYEAVNLGIKDTALKAKTEALTGLPTYVENDANAAALGEMWRGAGQGTDNLVAITLGTGIGGGIIIDGKIVHGVKGVGGEIGHVTVNPDGPLCNCGKKGCMERYGSATAIILGIETAAKEGRSAYLAKQLAEKGSLTAKDAFDAAAEGDLVAQEVIDQAAFYTGFGLSHIANLLNPAKIVIGGGVSAAGDALFSLIRKSFDTYTWKIAADSCEILPATLGNDAGVIGAGWLVKQGESK
ncbi:ROK family glucokinase [Brevibacillus laterosporus]|uniref:Glucokinase n=1 Tax=Brevibacillus laterosporus LMG 15441 TaxID=1042163 RepID=A0A075R131_BRELA|nr:ROK family glucokinase [Brevibacillus laterosporus]AIG24898.1 glucokinase [Brevibacillus laterosporus LMG 15441]RJL11167.1 glucokinase [Brevibacillus laterosporus]TPH13758.1 ROK family glucokinase [Brevibacillus laterosporus]HAS02066.1 glucokinase [Brevibacillus sp.]